MTFKIEAEPNSPTWSIFLPIQVNIGKTFSKAFLSPPTNIAIFPVAALWHPPLTGASNAIAFFSATNLPNLITSFWSVVLISIQILSLDIFFKIPFSPSITSAQIFGDGKQVITTSASFTRSPVDLAIFTPLDLNWSVIALFKSYTVKSNLFLCKLPASLPPTFPSPINPIFIF